MSENDDIEELWTQEECEGSVEMYEAKTTRIVSWLLFIGFMTLFGSCVSCEYIARTHHQCKEG